MKKFDGINVEELLPQQPPFVMIDRLIFFEGPVIITGLKITADNIFVEDGRLTETGLIENIAQTGACRMGYINKFENKAELKIGFIGEIKNMNIVECPHTGDEITTKVEVKNEIFSTLLVHAEVDLHGKLIAYGDMKISMTDLNIKS